MFKKLKLISFIDKIQTILTIRLLKYYRLNMATITNSTDLTRASDAPVYAHNSLPGLLQELFNYILLYLPVKNTLACSLVNNKMYQMTCNQDLWRALLKRDFNLPYGALGFSEMYQAQYSSLKFSEVYQVQSNLINGIYASYPFQRYMQGASALATADGKVIVGCHDRTIKVWDTSSGKCLHVFRGHLTPIIALAVYKEILFSVSNDYTIIPKSTICSWDLKTGSRLNTSNETGRINFLIVADGQLFSGSTHIGFSTNWQIKSRDLKTGVCLNTIMKHPGFLFENVAAIASGKLFAPCGDFNTRNNHIIKCWDLKTNELQITFKPHAGAIYKLIVTDKFLLSAAGDDMIVFWDLESGQELIQRYQLKTTSFVASDIKLFSGTLGRIIAWNWTGDLQYPITNDAGQITALDFAGGKLFSASLADRCMVCDFRPTSRKILAELLELLKSNNTKVLDLLESNNAANLTETLKRLKIDNIEKEAEVFYRLPNKVKKQVIYEIRLTFKPSDQNYFLHLKNLIFATIMK